MNTTKKKGSFILSNKVNGKCVEKRDLKQILTLNLINNDLNDRNKQ